MYADRCERKRPRLTNDKYAWTIASWEANEGKKMPISRKKGKGALRTIVDWGSGEWILHWLPNGGTAVFLRSLFVTSLIYGIAIALKGRLAEGATWEPALSGLRTTLNETLPWLGAIFAGVYVALYARFSTQWGYLASLYNQIMAAGCTLDTSNATAMECMKKWKAGFVEDAWELHLYKKPMFAAVVRSLLDLPEVKQCFIDTVDDGENKLIQMENYFTKTFASSPRTIATTDTATAATRATDDDREKEAKE